MVSDHPGLPSARILLGRLSLIAPHLPWTCPLSNFSHNPPHPHITPWLEIPLSFVVFRVPPDLSPLLQTPSAGVWTSIKTVPLKKAHLTIPLTSGWVAFSLTGIKTKKAPGVIINPPVTRTCALVKATFILNLPPESLENTLSMCCPDVPSLGLGRQTW